MERSQPTEVVQDGVDGGDEEEGGDGGRREAEGEAGGQRDEDLGLEAFFQQEGGEAGDGADGGEEDGPEAFPSRLFGGLGYGDALGAGVADEVDEQDGVVDDDAEQGGHADDAGQGEVEAQGQVPEYDADEGGGDDEHDGDGGQVAAELQGQEHVDDDEPEQDVAADGCAGLGPFFALALYFEAQVRVAFQQSWDEFRSGQGQEFLGIGEVAVDVSLDADGALTINAVDAGPAAYFFEVGDYGEGDEGPVATDDGEPFQAFGSDAVGGRQPQVDFVGFRPHGKFVYLDALEGPAHLIGYGLGVESQHAGAGFEVQAVFAFAGAQVVAEVEDAHEAPQPVAEFGGRSLEPIQVVAE